MPVTRLLRESINVLSPTFVKAIGAIVEVIDAEYVRRFPDVVAQLASAFHRIKDQAVKYQEELKIARAIGRGLREELDARDEKEEEEESYEENARRRQEY